MMFIISLLNLNICADPEPWKTQKRILTKEPECFCRFKEKYVRESPGGRCIKRNVPTCRRRRIQAVFKRKRNDR